MARRKRLSPPLGAGFDPVSPQDTPMPTRAPIAQVAGEAAAAAAFHDVAGELTRAREEGRLVLHLSLSAIDEAYLARDRMVGSVKTAFDTNPSDEPDNAMSALRASLIARGQQTPIEVVALGNGRYGLVSGWRRLNALRSLVAETGEARFETVLALLRSPEDAAAAYIAMVEENEIRSDLSFFERARIVRRAVQAGAFGDEQAALSGLFGAVSKSKRSKIKSFLRVVDALEGVLRHPTRLSEHLGLKLSKALEADPALPKRIARGLATVDPHDGEGEIEVLQTLVAHAKPSAAKAGPDRDVPRTKTETISPQGDPFRPISAGLGIKVEQGQITLRGDRLTPQFAAQLEAWLQAQDQG